MAQAEEAEPHARVRRAVAELPRGQRAAVTLFYLMGLTQLETAALLGIHVGAVKARLHKARGHLREALRELWSEERMSIETASEVIEVQVEDVHAVPLAEPPGERRVILLAEKTGERVLPIWVGWFESDSIAIVLVRGEAIRPLTFPFAAGLAEAAGGTRRICSDQVRGPERRKARTCWADVSPTEWTLEERDVGDVA
ncbi:MAG: DUF151 domain-containing protein [Chloroflexota bacterium]|nr:DUF151 domain-containing protein [Chloroflexota bacterium]